MEDELLAISSRKKVNFTSPSNSEIQYYKDSLEIVKMRLSDNKLDPSVRIKLMIKRGQIEAILNRLITNQSTYLQERCSMTKQELSPLNEAQLRAILAEHPKGLATASKEEVKKANKDQLIELVLKADAALTEETKAGGTGRGTPKWEFKANFIYTPDGSDAEEDLEISFKKKSEARQLLTDLKKMGISKEMQFSQPVTGYFDSKAYEVPGIEKLLAVFEKAGVKAYATQMRESSPAAPRIDDELLNKLDFSKLVQFRVNYTDGRSQNVQLPEGIDASPYRCAYGIRRNYVKSALVKLNNAEWAKGSMTNVYRTNGKPEHGHLSQAAWIKEFETPKPEPKEAKPEAKPKAKPKANKAK